MPINDKRILDYFAENDRQMKLLKTLVRDLRAKQLTTAPDINIADGGSAGIGVDYQIAIDPSDNSFLFHSNGAWHIAGGIQEITSNDLSITITNDTGPVTDLAITQFAYTAYDFPVTIPAIISGTPGSVTVDWTVNNSQGSGLFPFNYTTGGATATIPKFARSGNVVIKTHIQQMPGDLPLPPGTFLATELQSPAPIGTFPDVILIDQESVLDTNGIPTTGLDGFGVGNVSISDGIQFTLINSDTISHDVLWRIDIIQIVGT